MKNLILMLLLGTILGLLDIDYTRWEFYAISISVSLLLLSEKYDDIFQK